MNLEKKVLIAYASRAGSTAEIARVVGEEFTSAGWAAEVMPVQTVEDLTPYQAVVIGSAARFNKILPETVHFVKYFKNELQPLPVACFVSCLTMFKDTPKTREETLKYLDPLRKIKEPVRYALWGGAMFPEKIPGAWGIVMKKSERGDYRDWETIRLWSREMAQTL